MFIIQSIAYTDTATCERDLLIPIVAKIEGSRGKSRFIEDPRAVPGIPMESELAGDATPTENIYEHPSDNCDYPIDSKRKIRYDMKVVGRLRPPRTPGL